MITVLHLLSYVGGLAGFLFVTLSLASGLLWLAELIEEHSKYAKVIGQRSIYAIILLHLILIFTDSLPLLPTLFGIFSHIIYLTNFSPSWPFISLSSPKFILSCILVVADHFTWFFHFAAKAQEAKRFRTPKYRYGNAAAVREPPAFMDVAAFFAICVWFIPLFLFLSLSANDNALPSSIPSGPPSPAIGAPGAVDLSSPGHTQSAFAAKVSSRLRTSTPRSQPLLKSALTPLLSLLPRLRRNRKRDDEGLLAPRTPVRGSPLHSPVNMNASYFPWGEESGGSSSPSTSQSGTVGSYGNTLTADGAKKPSLAGLGRRGAPPPRRVQSEAVTQGINPRGIATRGGKPAVTDEGVLGEGEDMVLSPTSGTGLGINNATLGPIKVGLGPKDGEVLGNREVLDAKRKSD